MPHNLGGALEVKRHNDGVRRTAEPVVPGLVDDEDQAAEEVSYACASNYSLPLSLHGRMSLKAKVSLSGSTTSCTAALAHTS